MNIPEELLNEARECFDEIKIYDSVIETIKETDIGGISIFLLPQGEMSIHTICNHGEIGVYEYFNSSQIDLIEKLRKAITTELYCEYKVESSFPGFGIEDKEYKSSCGLTYDLDSKKLGKYCEKCGKEIKIK